jgi:hypothetical protein
MARADAQALAARVLATSMSVRRAGRGPGDVVTYASGDAAVRDASGYVDGRFVERHRLAATIGFQPDGSPFDRRARWRTDDLMVVVDGPAAGDPTPAATLRWVGHLVLEADGAVKRLPFAEPVRSGSGQVTAWNLYVGDAWFLVYGSSLVPPSF